jgi:hypothetical protein
MSSNAAESGIIAWDCKFDEEVMLIPSGLFIAGDNPMQAEECSHAGLNCNYFCRTCHVGGTKEYKESEVGYNSIFAVCYPETQLFADLENETGRKPPNTRRNNIASLSAI